MLLKPSYYRSVGYGPDCTFFFFPLEGGDPNKERMPKRIIHDAAYWQEVYGGLERPQRPDRQQLGEGEQPAEQASSRSGAGASGEAAGPQSQTDQVAGGLGTMALRKARGDLGQMGPSVVELRRLARQLYRQQSEHTHTHTHTQLQHVAPVLASEVYTCVPCSRVFCSHKAFSAHVGASGQWSQCRRFEYVQHKLGDVHDRQAHVGLIGRQVSGGEAQAMEQRDASVDGREPPGIFFPHTNNHRVPCVHWYLMLSIC